MLFRCLNREVLTSFPDSLDLTWELDIEVKLSYLSDKLYLVNLQILITHLNVYNQQFRWVFLLFLYFSFGVAVSS